MMYTTVIIHLDKYNGIKHNDNDVEQTRNWIPLKFSPYLKKIEIFLLQYVWEISISKH